MIQSLNYQRPLRLLQQYEFQLIWEHTDGDTTPYLAVVTVSHEQGVTTIVDISIEGDLPETFQEVWNPDQAIKEIQFELTEELNKITQN
jgi:hypothetical protein